MPRTLSALLLLALALPASAQPVPRSHDITVEDYFTLSGVNELSLSPDGKWVAYAEARWQKSSDDRKADLWVVNVETKQAKRLTFDRANDRSVKWGPDNKTLYFLAARKREGEKQPPYDGKAQVWRISTDGGEATAVTRVPGGVTGFDLTADGRTLFYPVNTKATDKDAFSALRQKFDKLEYGHGSRQVSQLWKLDLQTWRAEKIIDDNRFIREFNASRDGKRIALITAPDDKVITSEGRSTVDVWDAADGKVTRLDDTLWRKQAPSPYAWLGDLAWSPDNRRLAFCTIFDGYPAEVILTEFGGPKPASFRMIRPEGLSLKGYGTPLQWADANTLLYLGERAAHVRLYAATGFNQGQPGNVSCLTPGDVVVSGFFCSGPNVAIYAGNATSFPELQLVGVKGGSPQRLTNLNPQTASWKLPQIRTVTWKGAGGVQVGGVLELPPGYKEGQKLPLIVGIHGGPTTATYADLGFTFYQGRTIFPAKGYAVLCPNYRGSTGYGDSFITELIGRENDIEVEDILKGVDALVERGIADPDRLAVMGWSNGGYLTNCLITKTTRFKAASSGAGITDVVTEWGINDEPAYPLVFQKGLPWEKPEEYRRASPVYDLGRVRTPTIIHVGGADERCPPGQSKMLYRALKEYLNVPTELVVYPGEGHGPLKYRNRQALMEWDAAWFDRYVTGKK